MTLGVRGVNPGVPFRDEHSDLQPFDHLCFDYSPPQKAASSTKVESSQGLWIQASVCRMPFDNMTVLVILLVTIIFDMISVSPMLLR